jgi:uncharacterized membrane protein
VIVIAAAFAALAVASTAAAVWVFADTKRFDFRDSRVAKTRFGWAFGTLVALPLVWPLYRHARRTAPARGALPPRPKPVDRYEWIAFAVLGLPCFAAWIVFYVHDSAFQFLALLALSTVPLPRAALARRLRGELDVEARPAAARAVE